MATCVYKPGGGPIVTGNAAVFVRVWSSAPRAAAEDPAPFQEDVWVTKCGAPALGLGVDHERGVAVGAALLREAPQGALLDAVPIPVQGVACVE